MIELKYGTRKVVNFRGARKVVGGLSDQNKIEILLHISKEFSRADTEEELLNSVLNLSKEIFESDNTTVRLFEAGILVPVKYAQETIPPRRSLKPNEGYSGYCFQERHSILIPDLENHPEFVDEGEQTRSVMVVPVMVKEEPLGTISVESDNAYFYREDDIEILEALGSQLALALTNVRLIQGMVKARNREAKALQQLEFDMRMGRNVQKQIVNTEILPWNGLHFASYYEPMTEVSGDYFDVYRQGNSLTAIMADVAGHGIPAALVTMAIHYQFQRCVDAGMGLTEMMVELGESLRPQLPEGTYFTAFLLRIYSDYTFSYVNAAHHKLIQMHANTGSVGEYDTAGVPLGIFEVHRTNFEEKQGKLEPGDLLLLCTDGFSEQRNEENQELTTEGFLSYLDEAKSREEKSGRRIYVNGLLSHFIEKFQQYQGSAPAGDDLSLLAIQCNPELDNAREFLHQAKVACKEKKFTLGYKRAEDAYSLEPSLKEVLLLLGRLYFKDRNLEQSIHFLEGYIHTSGDASSEIQYLLGRAYYEAGRISEAKRALKRCLVIDPTFSKASLRLARCYLKEAQNPKALKVLKQGIKSAPGDESLKVALAKLEGIIQSKEKLSDKK